MKDYMKPSVYGIGFIGVGRHKATINRRSTKAYTAWNGMIGRCYSSVSQKSNPSYKGCTVDIEWHNFQNFANWFEDNYKLGLELDKDIKIAGNRIYSKTTCIMTTKSNNIAMAKAKEYTFLSPLGIVTNIYNLNQFCRDNNLDASAMVKVLSGKRNTHKGWTKE